MRRKPTDQDLLKKIPEEDNRVHHTRPLSAADRQESADLRASRARLQLVMDNIPQFIFWKDRASIYLGCNRNFARAAGVETPENIVGKSDYDLAWKKSEADFFRECDRRVMETDTPEYHIIEPQQQAGGRQAWLDTNKIPLHDTDGRVVGILGTYEDITERIQTQETLRLYEKIVATSRDLMSIVDTRYVYIAVNDAYLEAYQKARGDIVGRTAEELMGADVFVKLVKPHLDLTLSGETVEYEQWFEYPGRGSRYMHVSYYPYRDENHAITSVVVNAHDITRIKQLETKLNQAQKLEAIGTLAGGIAHDFNNLLTGIQGRTSLMVVDTDESHPHREHLIAIEDYINSATDLTKQLLGLARGGKYDLKPLDLNLLVKSTSSMFGRTKKEIRVQTQLYDKPLVVEADQGQMEQVLLNLYVNAWQAMPEGGQLRLDTTIADMEEADCRPFGITPGRYAKISITDTGTGIEASILPKIFDPFFTTKEKSRGTGLGLASAYGILKNHSGAITVYSEDGHGATFNIYLPLSGKEPSQETPVNHEMRSGSETILLVDDEEMIIDVGRAMLEKLGYRVITAPDGLQAMAQVSATGIQIDLVILDLIMPGMDGGKTFDKIRATQPRLPVLLSSGYSINGMAADILQRGCNGFIQKPFKIHELSQKVRAILDARVTGATP